MKDFIKTAQEVIRIEQDAITELRHKLDENFNRACAKILACRGKIVWMGIGKSGHIASKIAATLASTGTPAFFIHPAEAGHGDLGMINADDIVAVISYSGASDEILTLAPIIKRLEIPLIALTGNPQSALAKTADIHLDVGTKKEACPHNLAPTASTTAALVMGDALAMSLLEARGFSAEDFGRTHPSGALGKRLLTTVGDIMQSGEKLPVVAPETPITEALVTMSEKRLGFVIAGENQKVSGIFTDGDLRRLVQKTNAWTKYKISEVMRRDCQTIEAQKPAVLAVSMMEKHKINALPVIDKNRRLIGALNTHILLAAKII